MKNRYLFLLIGALLACSSPAYHTGNSIDFKDRIGLNFIRPDAGRPGHYDFTHSGVWLIGQYKQMGLNWNRLAFSWVLVQPQPDQFDWSHYDTIVAACQQNGISILATLGGHFDNPAVPAWAGKSLKEVVDQHPEYLHNFVKAWVERYKKQIDYWEILNEPYQFHQDLTVTDYVQHILKPSYTFIKSADPDAKVLPCAYSHLPIKGNKEDFWTLAKGYYDIGNLHVYPHWGYLRLAASADPEVDFVQKYRATMDQHGESDKPFWVTEVGWFGMAGIPNSFYGFYNVVPDFGQPVHYRHVLKPYYTGEEIINHPVTHQEDSLCAAWMNNLYPRLLAIKGCQKAFHWTSMDEFEGGYEPKKYYGKKTDSIAVSQVDLWGIIGGDKKWRSSAYQLRKLLSGRK